MWLRAFLFVPISIGLWVIHAFGWGTLGVLAFSSELVRQFDRGHNFFSSGFRSGLHCLALAPPVALVLLWRSEASGVTTDWFNADKKIDWILMVLRDRWEIFDVGALAIVALLLLFAMVTRRMEYSRNLAASALFLTIVFVLLPRIVFGSAYADMRLVPYVFAVAVVAIRLRRRATLRFAGIVAGVALAFARAMGEFGAVSVVSGKIRGQTNTVPLHVEILYNEYNFAAAFAVASLLALLAVVSL